MLSTFLYQKKKTHTQWITDKTGLPLTMMMGQHDYCTFNRGYKKGLFANLEKVVYVLVTTCGYDTNILVDLANYQ